MRTLSSTLTANQKSYSRPPLLKLVLTKSGQTTQTYDIDSSTNRIIAATHIEQEWSQIANFAVASDAILAALALEGYLSTISYGYNDATAGDEYSACAPLEVLAMKTDTLLNRAQSMQITWFSLAGVSDMMEADKASESLRLESTDQRTVKTLLTAIANATLAPFDHCKNYTITFDSEDSLIDTYIPADYFNVGFNESRLSAFKKLLVTTKCKARIERNTSTGVAEIHVFSPTISESTYNYEYNDAVSNHNFFEKSTRQRLVIPTKWIVSEHPDYGSGYTGSATDSASETALGRSLPSHKYIRATSNTQCTAIATALLQHDQVAAEKGHGEMPMNCGQEVMDYINITDSVAGDSRAGNVGYIKRDYSPGREFKMQIRFGRATQELPFMAIPSLTAGGTISGNYPTWDAFYAMMDYIDKKDELLRLYIDSLITPGTDELVVKKLTVTERMRIPIK